jgi:hypothetical protein
MNHIIVNCSLCKKEMKIRVAAGFKAPDTCMCKACSQGTPTNPARRYIKRSKTWMKN